MFTVKVTAIANLRHFRDCYVLVTKGGDCFPCFYRTVEKRVKVWENEKCNESSPKLLRVFYFLYNSIEAERECFFFQLGSTGEKINEHLCFILIVKI